MIVGPRYAVPDDIEAVICGAVRSIQSTGLAGGACAFRASVGYLALRLLGCKPHSCAGGVLYHAGPSAIRDTMAFCGRGNAGQIVDGHFIGHVWLEMDHELIDFACGNWPHLDPRAELLDAGLGPIRWYAPPPTFARLAAERFTRNRRALVWAKMTVGKSPPLCLLYQPNAQRCNMNRRGRWDGIPFIVAFEAHSKMAPGQMPERALGAVLLGVPTHTVRQHPVATYAD